MICQVMQLKTKVCSVLICLLPNSQQAAVLGFGCKLVQLQTPSLNHYVCLKKKKSSLPDRRIYKGSHAPRTKRIQATGKKRLNQTSFFFHYELAGLSVSVCDVRNTKREVKRRTEVDGRKSFSSNSPWHFLGSESRAFHTALESGSIFVIRKENLKI